MKKLKNPPKKTPEITNFNETSTLHLDIKIRTEFEITIKSNPTTGYQWLVDFDSQYFKLKETGFKATEPVRIGSGGKQTFNFEPIRVGLTILHFFYKRVWEEEAIHNLYYEINITS